MHKRLDLICLGRAGVDLYAEQIGSRLEDANRFSKYIGGSSTNIACCAARLGLKTALISRVGDEQMGRFIKEQLACEGVDHSQVSTDPERLTALVMLGIKDQDTFPLLFYRENCADMALKISDIDEEVLASAKALLITGTHLSTPDTLAVSQHALALAKKHGLKTILDIDYRPVLWGLSAKGDGETRFVQSERVSEHLQSVLAQFDLLVGTEEEIHIAGGSTDTLQALQTVMSLSDADVVVKHGPLGASVFTQSPSSLLEGTRVQGVEVEVLNVLGAGDAFMAGFLRGWLRGESDTQSLSYANACGALVVSRHGCTPAMPSVPELEYFLAESANIKKPAEDTRLNHLHRVTLRRKHWGELFIHAFDHRAQLVEMARQLGAPLSALGPLKALLLQATEQTQQSLGLVRQCGVLCDGVFAPDTLHRATGENLWLARPIEQPKSRPVQFEGGADVGTTLRSWPLDQIVKCLVFYHPDDEPWLRHQQEQAVQSLYRACCASGHELLLELIPPAGTHDPAQALCRAVKRFYNLDVYPDWWKLPATDTASMQAISAVIDERDPYCHGVLILGLDAPLASLAEQFQAVAGVDRVKGFAVGRSIFSEPSRAWLQGKLDDQALIDQVAARYESVIAHWQAAHTASLTTFSPESLADVHD